MAQETNDDDGARLTDDGIDVTGTLVSIEDYRHENHIEVVAETDDRVVVRDSAGYELSEWADDLGISRRDLSLRMHELAREHYGRAQVPSGGDPWCASDPLVLAKPDDDSDEETRLMTDGGVDTGGRHADMAPAEPMDEPRAVPHGETERVPAWARNAAVAIEREADASFIKFHVTRVHVYAYFDLEKRYIAERFLPDGVRIRGVGHPGSGEGSIKLKLSQPD
jgi:hypothetical protein